MTGIKLLMAGAAGVAILGAGAIGAAGGFGAAARAAEQVVTHQTVQRVDNFQLADQNFDSHELYRLKDAKAVILYTQMNGCPIVRNTVAAYKKLRDDYKAKGVEFLMINSYLADNRATN